MDPVPDADPDPNSVNVVPKHQQIEYNHFVHGREKTSRAEFSRVLAFAQKTVLFWTVYTEKRRETKESKYLSMTNFNHNTITTPIRVQNKRLFI